MPELPDIEVYLEALRPRIGGQPLEGARVSSPFLLRTVEPTLESFLGRRVEGLRRLGKRIVIGFEGERFMVLHLMVTGRLQWKPHGAKIPGRIGLAAFDFPDGDGAAHRGGIQEAGLAPSRRGGGGARGFRSWRPGSPGGGYSRLSRRRSRRESHTLKRALTDPHLLSGIGNSYSDEILHRARLSPFQLTRNLTPEETATLFRACREVLTGWTGRLRPRPATAFPRR